MNSLRKQIAELRSQAALAQARSLTGQAVTLSNGPKLLVARMDGIDPKALQVICGVKPMQNSFSSLFFLAWTLISSVAAIKYWHRH